MEENSVKTAAERTGSVELDYRAFWENNLQKMEEISSSIEKTLVRLEKKYIDFEESYEELTGSIDLLLSIYSSYNSIQGMEYLLRLKACLREYVKRHTHEGIRFNVLYHLHAKARELRSGSLSQFPRLDHDLPAAKPLPAARPGFEPTHRWITFKRHGAWFILPYDEVLIVPGEKAAITEKPPGQRCITLDGAESRIIDAIIPATGDTVEQPELYIVRTGADGTVCYAASSAGRRILAGRDIMRGKLRSYPNTSSKYIRLFGRNHIYIGG
jgi:hypothetical protein